MSCIPETYVNVFHDEDSVTKMPYRPLGNTGLTVSALSFGASSLGSVFRDTDDQESLDVVRLALTHGINYVDTAPWYGHGKSETVLGKILPHLPRESFYLATKVGRYEKEVDKMFDFSAERVLRSVDESLARLNLSHVDIIQIHDMEFAPNLDIIVNETLPALQKVKDSGKAKFIGITGYPLGNFKTVLERSTVKVDTILTYCRGSMNDNSLKDWLPFFKEKGVGVVNASPISMGLLSSRGPPAWHPATDHIKEVCAQASQYCSTNGVDISRLGLKFSVDQVDIPTCLVSTASFPVVGWMKVDNYDVCDLTRENVMKNIQSATKPLDETEKRVMTEVMERFMLPLENANWEAREVAEYRKNLEQQHTSK